MKSYSNFIRYTIFKYDERRYLFAYFNPLKKLPPFNPLKDYRLIGEVLNVDNSSANSSPLVLIDKQGYSVCFNVTTEIPEGLEELTLVDLKYRIFLNEDLN